MEAGWPGRANRAAWLLRLLTTAFSLLIVGAWFVFQWQPRWQDLRQLQAARTRAESALSEIVGWEAKLKARENAIRSLRQQVRKAEETLRLSPARNPAQLDLEWAPITQRRGLTVRRTGATPTDQPVLDVALEVEGPRDELFRMIDAMLLAPRPCQLHSIDLKCSANRASATMHWNVYWH